jgi:hypothetical protein
VGDAVARRRHGLKPVVCDVLIADHATPIGTLGKTGDGGLDVVELVTQLRGEGTGFALLGGHLCRVGEPLIGPKGLLCVLETLDLVGEGDLLITEIGPQTIKECLAVTA